MTVRSVPLHRPAEAAFARVNLARAWAPAFARDFGFVVGVIAVYFILRGQAPGNDGFAVALTWRLVESERAVGVFWEPAIQHWSIHFGWVKESANFVYAYLHFPVLIVVGAWLWFRGRDRFVFMRNTMFISMVIGLVCYYALPAAPPRLMAAHGYNLGFVDTIFGGGTHVSYAQPALILNNYAAIPSFHFGWIALASAAIWVNTTSRGLRAAAVLLSAVMGWAIVASANHLLVDMAIGAAVVGLSWWLARRIEARHPAATVFRSPADVSPAGQLPER
jgi:PAP2 superfamily